MTADCVVCGKAFRTFPCQLKLGRKYCSRRCYGEANSGSNNYSFTNGFIRSDGYRELSVRGRKVLEHRYVMEQHLGRRLTRWESVHHKDGNKTNNDLGNLEVLSLREHTIKHGSPRTATHKCCVGCGQMKPRTEFYPYRHGGRDPHVSRCKPCNLAAQKAKRIRRALLQHA